MSSQVWESLPPGAPRIPLYRSSSQLHKGLGETQRGIWDVSSRVSLLAPPDSVYCSQASPLLTPNSGLRGTWARLLPQSTQPPTLPTGPEEGRSAVAGAGGGGDSGGTSSLVNPGALSLISSTVMMAEAVAVRPSPDMSATCRVRLYTATTWGDGNMGSGDRVGTRPGLAGCCRARDGTGQEAGHLRAQPTQDSPVGSSVPCSEHQVTPSTLPAPKLWGKMCCLASHGLTAPLSTSDSAPVQEGARDQLPSQINIYEALTACRALRGPEKLGPCPGAWQR